MSHLGIKPASGGRPPKDSRVRIVKAESVGFLTHEEAKVEILVVDKVFIIKNIVEVITIYTNRFSSVNCGAKARIVTIHPRWAIDEKAIIFRSCVWFSPPQPPTREDKSPKATRILGFRLGETWRIRDIGASFCQVERMRPVVRSEP